MRILAMALGGLAAARERLAVAAENTVHMLDRGPKDRVFHARTVITAVTADGGVVARIRERRPAVVPLPDFDGTGTARLFAPNVEPAVEAVEMIRARTAFAAAARLVAAESERRRHLIDILDTGRDDRER